MAELINLRMVRKRAKRRQQDEGADAARMVHGAAKRIRKLATAQQEKASRDLDLHRIEPGDGR